VADDLLDLLPASWREAMIPYLDLAAVGDLSAFVAAEYADHQVFPPREDLFAAFRLCSLPDARVLILGQDPYHKAGQAHGLSFSVRSGVAVPPSLRNVFKEPRRPGVELKRRRPHRLGAPGGVARGRRCVPAPASPGAAGRPSPMRRSGR
jgi:uracil-DNA glycosylase